MKWSAVIPVKRLERAKTRLYDAVPTLRHGDLVLALAADTVTAALRCPAVERVIAVSDDAEATALLRGMGVHVVPDQPDSGLNPALDYGATRAREDAEADGIVVLASDLPALRPNELAAALAVAAGHPRTFVADAATTGTTVLTAGPGVDLDPRFGPGSAAAHAESGAVRLDGPWPSLSRDVDTAADLAAARALGLGSHTRQLLDGAST